MGTPISDGEITIRFDSIYSQVLDNPYYFESKNNSIAIKFHFRDCRVGEIYKKLENSDYLMCHLCVDNTYSME